MKRVKNTTWNRLFHGEEVEANVELMNECKEIVKLAPNLIGRIGQVTYTEGDPDSAKVTGATSLLDVLALHKEAWAKGFRNLNIGPCEYGIFRTENIETMTPDQVWLGNIYGLWTQNIHFWENERFQKKSGGGWPVYDYLTPFQIVLMQYKGILTSNIEAIADQAKKELDELMTSGY